jgi:hypothetical protein
MRGGPSAHGAGRESRNIDGVDAYVGRCPMWPGSYAINAIGFHVAWREKMVSVSHHVPVIHDNNALEQDTPADGE